MSQERQRRRASEASVAEVERVCAGLWEFVDDEAERDVPMYTERLGAYLGEVLRRTLGGTWVRASERDCPSRCLGSTPT